jgi:recombination protein RecA
MTDKQKQLDALLEDIKKKFGKDSIMCLGKDDPIPVEVIPTTSISLNRALGGGVPRGRIVEAYGPEGSGKTTLALHIISEAQRAGGLAAFIDVEHALDPKYAANLGVDLSELSISQPNSGEEALEIAENIVSSGKVSIVVIDSVAALVPKKELDGEMGDSHVGLHARLMSQAMRKLAGPVSNSNTCLFFINQIREKIGVMFGPTEFTTGGRALKYYASVRMDIRRIATIKDGDTAVGSRTRVKVVKNKLAPPFRECEFDIMYGKGISREGDILDLAVAEGIIKKSGAWFSYNDDKLGQGRDNSKLALMAEPDLLDEIEQKLQEKFEEGV